MLPRTSGVYFPPLNQALADPNGLLAIGGTLEAEQLVEAYKRGIFPWYTEGQPILWWSPNPRFVLFLDEFTIPRSLGKKLAQRRFELRFDSAFNEVIRACAEPRGGNDGTWITREMEIAYKRLHWAGVAHSAESWIDGFLAGGLYGVCIGKMFFGESMFTRISDASKIALIGLVRRLHKAGFTMIDCQQETEHLRRFGARPIQRAEFAERLSRLIDLPTPSKLWRSEIPND